MMSMQGPNNLSNACTSITVEHKVNDHMTHRAYAMHCYIIYNALPKHLTLSMAYAEAARGLLVTSANSPKYWPLEHVAISTSSSSVSFFD